MQRDARRCLVDEIKNNTVRNLSKVDIPDGAYLYLAKGLNFVESKQLDQQDLRFDAREFLRKLEWRAFFHQLGTENTTDHQAHPDLRIPSRKSPEDFQNNVVDDVKRRLLAFVDSIVPRRPRGNLGYLELEGKKWITQQIHNQIIFITKADKGGATLILDYPTALDSVKTNLANPSKFITSDLPVSDKMVQVRDEVRRLVLEQERVGNRVATGNLKHPLN